MIKLFVNSYLMSFHINLTFTHSVLILFLSYSLIKKNFFIYFILSNENLILIYFKLLIFNHLLINFFHFKYSLNYLKLSFDLFMVYKVILFLKSIVYYKNYLLSSTIIFK